MTRRCRVAALQDLSHEERCLPKDVGAIGRTTSGRRPRQMTSLSRRWQAVLDREFGDVFGRQTAMDDNGTGTFLFHGRECRINVFGSADHH